MHVDLSSADQTSKRLLVPARLLSDERLAQEVGAGNENAFAVLFNRYHQQLYRYCRSLTGNDQDAQDALQSTFTNALVALREVRRSAPMKPWLYRIAHNESISLMRSRRTMTQVPEELASAEVVHDTFEDRERLATLVADLQELPDRQRGALVMRELSGLSHEEIAQALAVSVGAAKQSILEARKSLLEFQEGRAMSCDDVLKLLSDNDGRSLRSRKVRAHLRACPSCEAFVKAIPHRRADMLALWPALPAASAAGLLAKLTGAGTGHGGGGAAGIAAGGAAKGVAATVSIKAAAAAGAAVVATATVGTVAVLHHSTPSQPASPTTHVAVHHGNPAAITHVVSHGSTGIGRGNAIHGKNGNVTVHGARKQTPGTKANSTSHGEHGVASGQGRGNNPSHGPSTVKTHGANATVKSLNPKMVNKHTSTARHSASNSTHAKARTHKHPSARPKTNKSKTKTDSKTTKRNAKGKDTATVTSALQSDTGATLTEPLVAPSPGQSGNGSGKKDSGTS